MQALDVLIPLAVAVCVTAAATPPVALLARRLGIVDRPNERKVSQRPDMPLLGGLAVALGFVAGLAAALLRMGPDPAGAPAPALILGATLMVIVGAYDDRHGLSALPKALLSGVAAAIAIAAGFQIEYVTDPVSRLSTFLPDWASWLISLLWIVGITNALNLVDGLDGLAAGVGIIIGTTLTVIAWQVAQPLGVCLGVALVGSLLGFLPYNFSPARIFLGDTGSLFTGYVLALLALEGYRQVTVLTFVVPLLALALPILDTVLSIFRRLRLGVPVFSADRLHMHHRLLASEGSQRSAVLQFYFLTAAFCLIALSFTRLQGIAAAGFLAAVALLTLRLLRNLGVFSAASSERPPSAAHTVGGEEKR